LRCLRKPSKAMEAVSDNWAFLKRCVAHTYLCTPTRILGYARSQREREREREKDLECTYVVRHVPSINVIINLIQKTKQ